MSKSLKFLVYVVIAFSVIAFVSILQYYLGFSDLVRGTTEGSINTMAYLLIYDRLKFD